MFLLSYYAYCIKVTNLIVIAIGLDLCGTLFTLKLNALPLCSVFCLVQTLTDILCNQLGKDELKLNSKILSLSYSHGGRSGLENWSVSSVVNDDQHSQSLSVDAVIMTVSIYYYSKNMILVCYLPSHEGTWCACLMLLT